MSSVAQIFNLRVLDQVTDIRQTRTIVAGDNLSLQDFGSGIVRINAAAATPGGSSGQLQANVGGAFAGLAASIVATSGTHLLLTAQAATDAPFGVKGASGQSGDYFFVKAADDEKVLRVVAVEGSLGLNEYRTCRLNLYGRNGFGAVVQVFSVGQDPDSFGEFSVTGNGRFANNLRVDGTLKISGSGLTTGGSASIPITISQLAGAGQEILLSSNTTSTARLARVLSPASGCYPLTIDGAAGQTAPLVSGRLVSSVQTRDAFDLTASWATATDASRKARVVFNVYDTAAREAIRIEADGSNPMLGLLGATATARETVTGSRGGNAALADLLTKLATKGIITDGSSA